jgi:hypothetical protein
MVPVIAIAWSSAVGDGVGSVEGLLMGVAMPLITGAGSSTNSAALAARCIAKSEPAFLLISQYAPTHAPAAAIVTINNMGLPRPFGEAVRSGRLFWLASAMV